MKTLLLLGAGREQLLAINQAHELGLNVVACDQNPEAPGLAQADHAVVGDIRDPEAMYGVARQHDVSGVFTHAVEIPDVVALVAWRLGLPGLDPEIAARATNKVRRIRHLTEQGIPCARYAVADTESDRGHRLPVGGLLAGLDAFKLIPRLAHWFIGKFPNPLSTVPEPLDQLKRHVIRTGNIGNGPT